MFLISVGSQPNPSSLTSKLFQNRIIPSLKTPSLLLHPNPLNKGYPKKPIKISALTTQETSILDETTRNEAKQKLGVLVKPMRRPRLVLKFIWMEKNIGIGIDQVIPGGYGTIPLSQYYFWPKKDAWGELKVMLESKPWISQKEIVVLLNQATDIINLWQQSGGDMD